MVKNGYMRFNYIIIIGQSQEKYEYQYFTIEKYMDARLDLTVDL
jgi:hypothetical protein